jgi:NAD(P)-dependent dehydrogenase (short-subunit alcohol dehydrogenase family)
VGEDRIVVVFGGTGALGRAVVDRIAGEGDGEDGDPAVSVTVVVGDRAIPPDAHDDARANVRHELVDVLDEDSVARLFSSLPAAPWGVVNVVGGFATGTPLVDLDLGVLRRQLELNLVTATIITKHALGFMRRDGSAGRIVHTSSRAAVQDGRNSFAYSVSKLGVVRLVEAAAAESKDLGVTVNCVMPSVIDTPANRESMPKADYDRWPKPGEIATVIAFLLSDGAALISGAAIPVYGRA